MTKPRLSLACVLATLLTGCGRVVFEWQGPTDNFRALDVNSDGDVDRFEWEQSHGAVFDKSLGFRSSDCDTNGRVSWHEYFVGYMHLEHCPGRYLYESPLPPPSADSGMSAYASYEDDGEPDNWVQGTLLVRPEENLQIYERMPEGPDMPTLLRPVLRPPPARYSEQDLPPAAQQRLRFTSGRLADAVLVSRYDSAENIPGNEVRAAFPHLGCAIANENANVRITMADVEVVWHADGRESRERYLKPVWIEPGHTQRLDAWFAGRVDSAECRLLDARGQVLRKSA
jgi:hypothetical protein